MRRSLRASLRFPLPVAALVAVVLAAGCTVDQGPFIESSPPLPPNCGATAACPLAQECLAIAENHAAPQFGLRIAELSMSSPEVFVPGSIMGGFLEQTFLPSLPACFPTHSGLTIGAGATSWLLRFDLDNGTLTMGGATPPADPMQGYTLLDAMVPQGGTTYHVAPVTFDLSLGKGETLDVVAAQDLALPMFFPGYLTSSPTVLPLHALTASEMVFSPTHDCIGHYDPSIFDDAAFCEPKTHDEMFVHAGHLEAYVSLEEADTIDMGSFLGETLCAMLTGNAEEYSDDATPLAHCKRTGGIIDFKGDWCSTTNGPATVTCADAVHFVADFAASAVVIHG